MTVTGSGVDGCRERDFGARRHQGDIEAQQFRGEGQVVRQVGSAEERPPPGPQVRHDRPEAVSAMHHVVTDALTEQCRHRDRPDDARSQNYSADLRANTHR